MQKIFVTNIIATIILSLSTLALANEVNKKETMLLSSDRASCTYVNSKNLYVCTYLGNAKLTYGIKKISAPKIVLHTKNNNAIDKIVASGKGSRYIENSENKQMVDAQADLIEIYPKKKLVIMTGNGTIQVNKDSYSGPKIKYTYD